MDGDDSILSRMGVIGVALLVVLSLTAGAGVAVADNAYKVGEDAAKDAGDDDDDADGDDGDDAEDMEVTADDVENTMDGMGMDMEMVEETTGMTSQDIADMLNEMLEMMSSSASGTSA